MGNVTLNIGEKGAFFALGTGPNIGPNYKRSERPDFDMFSIEPHGEFKLGTKYPYGKDIKIV